MEFYTGNVEVNVSIDNMPNERTFKGLISAIHRARMGKAYRSHFILTAGSIQELGIIVGSTLWKTGGYNIRFTWVHLGCLH